MKKVLSILILSSFVFSFFNFYFINKAEAQNSSCISLKNNMKIGDRDIYTHNQVTKLQNFLVSKGYLYMATGYFGYSTKKGVMFYQQEKSLKMTGYVGPLTRSNISEDTCSTSTENQSYTCPINQVTYNNYDQYISECVNNVQVNSNCPTNAIFGGYEYFNCTCPNGYTKNPVTTLAYTQNGDSMYQCTGYIR
ncbi:MAG: peptidoglycan-binding protein [Candidatus Pacebacteria bacterium]|nr:peptidoglycan-binding protein [Candidatus Paceibacterota bacterium]